MPTNLPKNAATVSKIGIGWIAAWDDEVATWDSSFFTWDNNRNLSNVSKNAASITNVPKS